MWVLKFQGQTFYVDHVDCNIPWSTKETSDNSHTKGSIKVKNALVQIDDNNHATLSALTTVDKIRLKNQKLGINRIIVKQGYDYQQLLDVLSNFKINHSPIKSIGGACTSTFYITDILDKSQFTMLALAMSNCSSFRILMPNEHYYKYYSDPTYQKNNHIDLDDILYDEED